MRLRFFILLLCFLPVMGRAQDRRVLSCGGRDRSYYVHVPPGWDGHKPLPLLILLHGGGGNATQALKNYPLQQVADREGFLLVAPNGSGRLRREILLTWNVGFGFGYAKQEEVDDSGFLRALIVHLEKTLPVDPTRVYLSGLSNGAILCHWAATANSDLIAGIAPVVGTLGGRDMDEEAMHLPPKPAHPLDVILFNGSLDEHLPPEGGLQKKWAERRKFLVSAQETARFWVEANGCNPTPLVEELKELQATRSTWSGGKQGTRVVLYLIHNQGHAWPGGTAPRGQADRPTPLLKAHEVLWQFFSASRRHSLLQGPAPAAFGWPVRGQIGNRPPSMLSCTL